MSQTKLLTDISPYVYGTTRLGDDKIVFEDRVKVARAAMDADIWFHTSHTYGDALKVLRTAFDQERAKIPKLIVKAFKVRRAGSVELSRAAIVKDCRAQAEDLRQLAHQLDGERLIPAAQEKGAAERIQPLDVLLPLQRGQGCLLCLVR